MSSESLEELKAIINNAPEGATHYSIDESVYYKFKCECWMFCHRGRALFEFVKDDDYVCNELRLLSDIKRIIKLEERIKENWKAYGRIEAVKQKYSAENEQLKERLKNYE